MGYSVVLYCAQNCYEILNSLASTVCEQYHRRLISGEN